MGGQIQVGWHLPVAAFGGPLAGRGEPMTAAPAARRHTAAAASRTRGSPGRAARYWPARRMPPLRADPVCPLICQPSGLRAPLLLVLERKLQLRAISDRPALLQVNVLLNDFAHP